MKKNKFIIIWPQVFREFDFYRLEIEQIEKDFDVEVHELAKTFDPSLIRIYNKKTWCRRKIVKRYSSLWSWVDNFKKIKKNQNVVVMFNFHINSLSKFLVRFFLMIWGIKIIKYSKSNLPEPKLNTDLVIYKLKNNFSINSTLFFMSNFFFNFLSKFFTSDYILSMSYSNYIQLKKKFKRKPIIIKASSYDYSNALIYKPTKKDKVYKNGKFSVLLDTPGPRDPGDEVVYRVKVSDTSEKWYPAINNFFSLLESNFNTIVKIAPHPKTKPKKFSKEFNYRETLFNKLAYVVKNAKIVITRLPGSTAVVYAAIYKKPLIFVHSNEMLKHKNFLNSFKVLLKEFKSNPININESFSKKKIIKAMHISKKKYDDYIKKYGTARSDKMPNHVVLKSLLKSIYLGKKLNV